MLGMLSARALRAAGLSVVLLERGEAGREASWAGGGILSPLIPWQYADAISELVVWSQRFYPVLVDELLEQTGIDAEWVQSGILFLDTPLDSRDQGMGHEVPVSNPGSGYWANTAARSGGGVDPDKQPATARCGANP